MRALVTGGAGFIGSHIADRLLEKGYDVRVIDSLDPRVHPRGKPAYLSKDIEFMQDDVTDPRAMTRALRQVDVVCHQAAYQDYMPDFSRFLRVNAASTALLYEQIVEERLPVRKVIVASSQAVYGEGQYNCPRDGFFQASQRSPKQLARGEWEVACPRCGRQAEPLRLDEMHANPGNSYAISKYTQEMIALRVGRYHGIPSVALRYSITQGPRQSPFNAYSGVLRIFTQRLWRERPPVVFEDGKQQRDYVHVDDVVDAAMLVLDDPRADFEAFNVGSGKSTTVTQYMYLLADMIGREANPVLEGEYRVGDNRHSVSSVEKLKSLGWRPRRNLQHIVSDYLDWARANPSDPESDRCADRAMRIRDVIRRASSKPAMLSRRTRAGSSRPVVL